MKDSTKKTTSKKKEATKEAPKKEAKKITPKKEEPKKEETPKAEPKAKATTAKLKTAGELLYEKWKNGTTLKATLEHLVAIPKSTPQLEGLVFVNRPSGKAALSPRQRLQKNIHLCHDLLLLNALPGSPFIENPDTIFRTRRFAFLHAFRFFYLRAFADAYEIARAEKMPSDFGRV